MLSRALGVLSLIFLCGDTEEACENHDLVNLDNLDDPRPEIALDTNVLINALEKDRMAQVEAALGDRRPVISPAALDEFFKKPQPDTQIKLDIFMATHQGRTGAPHDEELVKMRVEQSKVNNAEAPYPKPPTLRLKDGRILDSAMQERLPVMTYDEDFHKYMISIGWEAKYLKF